MVQQGGGGRGVVLRINKKSGRGGGGAGAAGVEYPPPRSLFLFVYFPNKREGIKRNRSSQQAHGLAFCVWVYYTTRPRSGVAVCGSLALRELMAHTSFIDWGRGPQPRAVPFFSRRALSRALSPYRAAGGGGRGGGGGGGGGGRGGNCQYNGHCGGGGSGKVAPCAPFGGGGKGG